MRLQSPYITYFSSNVKRWNLHSLNSSVTKFQKYTPPKHILATNNGNTTNNQGIFSHPVMIHLSEHQEFPKRKHHIICKTLVHKFQISQTLIEEGLTQLPVNLVIDKLCHLKPSKVKKQHPASSVFHNSIMCTSIYISTSNQLTK